MPGIDPHRLHEADPAELVKALELAMQRVETLEAENQKLQQQNQKLRNVIRKLRQLIRDWQQQIGSCGCQTDPASLSADFEIADQLKQENQDLRQQLESSERENHRSATPFSKGKRKENPQKPGRKPGQGKFRHKPAPEPREPDEIQEFQASLDTEACPKCGAKLERQASETATTIDLPRLIGRVIKYFSIEVAECTGCGHKVRGTHPELAKDQFGATAHRIGSRVDALALALHYDSGMSLRQAEKVLNDYLQIPVTQSAITQKALKAAEQGKLGELAQEIKAELAQADIIHTDDTGWKVGGTPHFLMTFCNEKAIYYQIERHHRAAEVAQVIDPSFRGIVVVDGFTSYQPQSFDSVPQQRCLAHRQRNLTDLADRKAGKGRWFANYTKDVFRQAMELRELNLAGHGTAKEFQTAVIDLKQKLDHHLRPRSLSDPDNQKMLNSLWLQNQKGQLLRFLDHPKLEPTNNRAERALRPGVKARKVSQCSKNQRGAQSRAAITSVTATSRLKKESVLETLASAL